MVFGRVLTMAMAGALLVSTGCKDSNSPGGSGSDGGGVDGQAADGDVDTDGTVGPCEQPLDEETLAHLTLIFFPPVIQMQPGESRTFEPGIVECCYFFTPVNACVEWSVDPEVNASIAADGTLTIGPNANNGDSFMVAADVEQGRRVIYAEVWVYTVEDNPFVGQYTETAQFDCNQGNEFTPTETIGELMFMANGEFALTWQPFEVYVDYWGTYTYDLVTGDFSITPTGGNYIPTDIDGQGTFSFDTNGDLLFHDMFLGSPSGGTDPPACGHRFQ